LRAIDRVLVLVPRDKRLLSRHAADRGPYLKVEAGPMKRSLRWVSSSILAELEAVAPLG